METLAVSVMREQMETVAVKDVEHTPPLQLQERPHTQTHGRKPKRNKCLGGESLSWRKGRKRVEKSLRGCKYGDCCQFRHTEVDSQVSQEKVKDKWRNRISGLEQKFSSVVYPKIALRKSLFCGRLIESHRQVLQEHMAPRKKSGKEGLKMRTSRAKSVVSKIRERTQDETLKQERCARRESLGPGKGCL